MSEAYFKAGISRHIWDMKYRYREHGVIRDTDITDTWRRVAHALASVEAHDREKWQQTFYGVLEDFRFIPAGRILAGSGTSHRVTLFNCFVMGTIEDSMDGIFQSLKEAALTMQQGGGAGFDFSTLRPAGVPAKSVGTVASGPVSFMHIWDAMCATLLSTGNRRGAMMATIRCDHPDIEAFIRAKSGAGQLRNFNLSVQITDSFMQAVRDDGDWPLVFPDEHLADEPAASTVMRRWPGYEKPVSCRVMKTVAARQLWDDIMRATYDYAEPGVLYIDRINHMNNLYYREYISATNPCGEIPLPPYGACDLGSLNLTRFVHEPFGSAARFDYKAFVETAEVAVRMMDNVIDLSRFPLEQQGEQVKGSRRIGLGITGLGDALIMLGHRYGDEGSLAFARKVMSTLCHTAYRCSGRLAEEKGAFPCFVRDAYLQGNFIATLPDEIRDGIAEHGIRNSHLIAIAPTGTISLLANNISSGLEPVFSLAYKRKVLETDGHYHIYDLLDYAWQLWRDSGHGGKPPEQFVTAHEVPPRAHLDMQAAIQPYVDNAISKTINIPADYSFDEFRTLYEQAYDMGMKGCTTFRSNPVTGEILTMTEGRAPDTLSHHCCTIDREND